MVRLDPQTREQELRDYLGGFDFRGDGVGGSRPGDHALRAVLGGEKSRLALALLIWQRPNLLLRSTSRPTTSTSRCATR